MQVARDLVVYNSPPAQRKPVADPKHLQPRPDEVVGRDELLAEIKARLGDRRDVAVVALCGLAGIGKTTLAVEFAYRHIESYRLVWHLHGQSEADLAAQFYDMANALGLDDDQDPIDQVHNHLANAPWRWLLIFDNVPDHPVARQWLPSRGRGHVLITTRDGFWPANQALLVNPLDRATATQLLLDHARRDDKDELTAATVAADLDGLPLALAQAAAYLAHTGVTLKHYADTLKTAHLGVLSSLAPADHPDAWTVTWTVSTAALARKNKPAITLLRLLACMSPDDIPFRLLLGTSPRSWGRQHPMVAIKLLPLILDTSTLDKAIDGLRHYSLVGPPSETVSIHRLVQATTLDQLNPRQQRRWRRAAAGLINAAVPADMTAPEAWPVCEQLLPHAHHACDPLSDTVRNLIWHLGPAGKVAAARSEYSALYERYSASYGPEHPTTLMVCSDLAAWTGYAGDAATARDMYRDLLPLSEGVCGPEHPDTLTVRNNLAVWTESAGDAATARDMYRDLLPIRERVSGPEHPSTLILRNNLAAGADSSGNVSAARDMYRDLLTIRERELGSEHPDTLRVRANLAGATGSAGDAVAARDMYRDLLPVSERVSGPEHPHTLGVRNGLATWTGEAGDAAAARDMYRDLLPVSERVSGPEHPDTLGIRNRLASWTGRAGDAAAARDMYRDLLPVSERASGPEHPNTLAIRANLAAWTGEAGDAAAARDMYRDLLPVSERISGPEHPHTVGARNNLAAWTRRATETPAFRRRRRRR